MNKCDICIEEQCAGSDKEYTCDCDNCKQSKDCYKWIRPTIRITTKCTQSCTHCCFECSPDKSNFMSVATAESIRKFIENSPHIRSCNLMGGEIFCNPNYKEILSTILSIESLISIRIVTNGDWSTSKEKENFIDSLVPFKDKIHIAISNDKWHTNENVEKAQYLLDEADILNKIDDGAMTDESIIPIGRSQFNYNIFSMFASYCQGYNAYSILIDEQGRIYKCPFGAWQYDDVANFLNGGFEGRFKEMHGIFRTNFISSCKSCVRADEQHSYLVGEGNE